MATGPHHVGVGAWDCVKVVTPVCLHQNTPTPINLKTDAQNSKCRSGKAKQLPMCIKLQEMYGVPCAEPVEAKFC